MKVKSTRKTEKFNPVELTITIESKNELFELYARFNASLASIKTCIPSKAKYSEMTDTTMVIFKELEKIYNQSTM
ncbi:MAG: hypothetical protein WC055_01920 [Melioribacteraceae bacterium]